MLTQHPLPPLSAIRAFEAAARLQSFSRAAEELGMTGAAVSYQVKQLEERVGMTLFARHPRRVELTEDGEALAPLVSGAFAALRQAFARASDRADNLISVTTLPTVGGTWLAPKLGSFSAKHQLQVRLDLSVPASDFSTSGFDAAIRSGGGEWPGLRSYHLLPNLFAPVCSPALRQAAACLEDPRAPFPFQLLGRHSWWTKWYGALGFPEADLAGRFGIRFDVEQLDVAAAIAGHGVAMVSPIFFRHELEAGTLVLAHDLIVSDNRGYWFTFPAARVRQQKLLIFRDWLIDHAKQDLEAVDGLLKGVVTISE